jgi:hypothetical protein
MAFRFERVRARWAFEDYLDRLRRDHPQYEYGWDEGRGYLKIWRQAKMGGRLSRSAVAFVDPAGNVYRAESWKKRGRLLAHAEKMGQGVPTGSGRDPRRHRHRTAGAPTFREQRRIHAKMRILERENATRRPPRSQAQMLAIAYRYAGVPPRPARRRRRLRS